MLDKLVFKVVVRVVFLRNIDVVNKWVNGILVIVVCILEDCIFIKYMKEGIILFLF